MASVDLGANFGNGGSTSGGGGGGGSGTVTQVNTGGLATGGPFTTTGTVTVSSISLSTDVVGLLPVASLASLSFTNISGSLPVSRTTGSISLANQVSGILPIANVGSSSFTDISGSLPLSRTTGSISLANQVSGLLPIASVGSSSFTDISGSLPLNRVTGSTFAQAIIFNGGALAVPAITINNASTTTGGRGLLINMTGTAGDTYGIEIANSKTTAGAVGFFSHMTGTTGATQAGNIQNDSSDVGAVGSYIGVTNTAGTGTGLNAYHFGTAGYSVVAYTTSSATANRDSLQCMNQAPATNNNSTGVAFTNKRTTGGDTVIAAVRGMIVDVTNTAYKGALQFMTANNAAPAERMRVDQNGSVSIGVASASAQLHTTGTVRFANFGVGTATFDVDGNISSVSDEDLKDIKQAFSEGLERIKKINPIVYRWKANSGLDTKNDYVGWSAQNLNEALSGAVYKKKIWVDTEKRKLRDQKEEELLLSQEEAIAVSQEKLTDQDAQGKELLVDKPDMLPSDAAKKDLLSVSDRAVMAAMVNAFKEISLRLEAIEQLLGL